MPAGPEMAIWTAQNALFAIRVVLSVRNGLKADARKPNRLAVAGKDSKTAIAPESA